VPQPRLHYERAFESALVRASVPFVSVAGAKRARLAPGPDHSQTHHHHHQTQPQAEAGAPTRSLKSFDYCVYTRRRTLLVDVKGRRMPRPGAQPACWITQDDLDSLETWASLLTSKSSVTCEAMLAFVHHLPDGACDRWAAGAEPYRDGLYAIRVIPIEAYRARARQRSPRWATLDLPTGVFQRVSIPLAEALGDGPGAGSPRASRAYARA